MSVLFVWNENKTKKERVRLQRLYIDRIKHLY